MYALYQLHRHHFLGWPLLRWLILLLVIFGLLAAVHLLPGGSAASAITLSTALLLYASFVRARRRLFVRFHPEREARTAPETARDLPTGATIPLYVTGLLSVGKREQIVVHAPGSLEQFRSGERAISALVRPSRLLFVGALPARCEGMWYTFVRPDGVEAVESGSMDVKGRRWPALCVRFRDEARSYTLYLAFSHTDDQARAYALFTSP